MSRVTSSSSSSKVTILDGNGNAIISGNPLSVAVEAAGTIITMYQSSTGVAMGSSSTILSYTVPIDTTLALNNIMISSDSISVLDIQINNVVNNRKRLTYTQFNQQFDYAGFQLNAGDNIKVVGTNNSNQGVAEFNVTLIGVSS